MELTTDKYKLTEVGLIPIDWKVKPLNDVSKITRLAGYEYSSVWQEDENGEIIALRGFNIGQNKIVEKEFVRISNKLSLQLNRSRLYKGNVIYPCVGTIGNAAVIEDNDKYHIQQNIAKITPDEKQIYPYYLSYYLMSFYGFNEIFKFNGTSSQPNILVGSLRQYSIVLPPLTEQITIATALCEADKYITYLEKLIAKKRFMRQGAMQQLLQPKKGWETKKLGEIGKCFRGVSYNGERDLHPNDNDITVRLLRSNNVQQEIIELNELQFVDKLRVKDIQYLQENDILICMANGSKQLVGKSAFFKLKGKSKYTFGAFMGCFRTFLNEANPDFIFYNFLSYNYRSFIDVLLSGSSINNLKPSDIESIEIPFPKKTEQIQISAILSDMDIEIVSLEEQLTKAQGIKQGMMQQLLTGKIRLV